MADYQDAGFEAFGYRFDITDEEEVEAAVKEIESNGDGKLSTVCILPADASTDSLPVSEPWLKILRTPIDCFALAAENVGLTSRPDPNDEILQGWIRSQVHLDNLEARPFNATGIGIARAANGTLYYTQLYVTFPR